MLIKFIYLIFYEVEGKVGIYGAYSSQIKAKTALEKAQKNASDERMKDYKATYKLHVEQVL